MFFCQPQTLTCHSVPSFFSAPEEFHKVLDRTHSQDTTQVESKSDDEGVKEEDTKTEVKKRGNTVRFANIWLIIVNKVSKTLIVNYRGVQNKMRWYYKNDFKLELDILSSEDEKKRTTNRSSWLSNEHWKRKTHSKSSPWPFNISNSRMCSSSTCRVLFNNYSFREFYLANLSTRNQLETADLTRVQPKLALAIWTSFNHCCERGWANHCWTSGWSSHFTIDTNFSSTNAHLYGH